VPHACADSPQDTPGSSISATGCTRSKAAPLPPALLEAELTRLRRQLASSADEKARLRADLAAQRKASQAAAQDACRHIEAASSHAMLRRVAERRAAEAEEAERYYAWVAAACAVVAGLSVGTLANLARQSSS
jgi:hypothetical protein